MIIGHGDIASAIIDRPGFTFFASGVSNSGETRASEFRREWELLMACDRSEHVVYFSSLSIFYANGPYQQHKRNMEHWVKEHCPLHAIIRIGNITWGSNPYTLINHLRKRHAMNLKLDVQDVYRYVIDRPTFQAVIANIPTDQSFEFNAYGRRLKVAQIVDEFVLGQAVTA